MSSSVGMPIGRVLLVPGFSKMHPAHRRRSIPTGLEPFEQSRQVRLQVGLVLRRRHSVHTRREGGWGGIIGAMLPPLEIDVATGPQSTEVYPLEFSIVLTPLGRLFIVGQVPSLAGFRGLRGASLWMRCVEPEETSPEDAYIEIAAETSSDEGARTARVVARAAMPDRKAWALYRVVEVQGLVDLKLVGSGAPGTPQEVLHLLVRADLSRRAAEYGLSAEPFPQRYV